MRIGTGAPRLSFARTGVVHLFGKRIEKHVEVFQCRNMDEMMNMLVNMLVKCF